MRKRERSPAADLALPDDWKWMEFDHEPENHTSTRRAFV
jgi:hypothetical protein